MSAISSAGLIVPGSRWTLVPPAPGAPAVPRLAWPVVSSPNCRAEALFSSQPVSRPPSTIRRGAVATPSPSNGLERSPRGRCGSSTMTMSSGKICSSSRPSRKLVLRAMPGPVIALTRWPIRLPPTRGSKTTGIVPLASLAGLSRFTARSPASRPSASAASMSA